ncbi:MAG TPA: hypothetical protein DIS69_00805 [Moraxellaceae bacterium]|nr:hypothetical protein [Moraxella sp.]HCN14594.1 hypothetical protein [Moraxellaceae bacterium]
MAYTASLPKAFNQIARNTAQLTEANRPPLPMPHRHGSALDDEINPVSINKSILAIDARDEIYQAMLDDDIDLYNPHLNVRDAYVKHIEQQNADIKTQINDLQDLLSQADRVILALLASLLVFAVIAVAMVWR